MTYSFTITPGANAVQLSAALIASTTLPKQQAGEQATSGLQGRVLMLHADAANTGVLYIGGNNQAGGTTSAAYGFRMEIPASSIPAAPVVFEFPNGVINLDEFWVKAAQAADKLHVFIKD